MRADFPVVLDPQPEGGLLVSFPDVPEALTEAATRAEALEEAIDCLIAALGGYMGQGRDLPVPSQPSGRAQHRVILPPLVAAKLELYQAMRDAGLSRVALGHRLGITEGAIRRLLDLDHQSHIGKIDRALAALGKRLTIEVHDAA
jgi:antitoxin HicB